MFVIPAGNADNGHEYWRLILGAAQGSASWTVNLTEVTMSSEIGGVDLCTGGTASASSTSGTNYPSNAFDDNNSTRWQAAVGGAGQSIVYQFISSVNVREFSVMYSGFLALLPSSIEVQYSDDGVSYTSIGTYYTSAWVTGVVQTFTI